MKIADNLPRDKAKDWPMMVDFHLRNAYKWGCDLKFQIKPDEESRSQKQNRLLWKLHGELAKHIHETQGNIFDGEEIHEFVVGKLLPRRAITMPDGEPVIVRASTRKLTVKEFAEFLDKYYAWAADSLGCQLTMPDDLYWDALMRENPNKSTGGDGHNG